MVMTGTGIFPDSHLQTMIVILLLANAALSVSAASSAWHSTTFSQPHAVATAESDVFLPAYVG